MTQRAATEKSDCLIFDLCRVRSLMSAGLRKTVCDAAFKRDVDTSLRECPNLRAPIRLGGTSGHHRTRRSWKREANNAEANSAKVFNYTFSPAARPTHAASFTGKCRATRPSPAFSRSK